MEAHLAVLTDQIRTDLKVKRKPTPIGHVDRLGLPAYRLTRQNLTGVLNV